MAATALELLGSGETEIHARAHTMANNHMESVKIWKGLIQTDRNNPETWRGLAKALLLQGTITLLRNAVKANEIESKVINNSTRTDY